MSINEAAGCNAVREFEIVCMVNTLDISIGTLGESVEFLSSRLKDVVHQKHEENSNKDCQPERCCKTVLGETLRELNRRVGAISGSVVKLAERLEL